MAYIGTQPKDIRSFGKAKFDFTATQGQTSFFGLDDDGKTLHFTAGQITVYLNGILLDESDYWFYDGMELNLNSPANAGDILSVVALQTDIPNSDYVPATGGTFSGNVTIDGAFTSRGIDDNAASTAITLDASGNVLVGATSGDVFTNQTRISVNGTNYGGLSLFSGGSRRGQAVGSSSQFEITSSGEIPLLLGTNDTERMRIDPSGNVLCGSDAGGDIGSPSKRFRDLHLWGKISYSADTGSGTGGLNVQSRYTYNDGNNNFVGTLNSGFTVLIINQGSGSIVLPFFQNAGGGVAWSGSLFDPDAGSFVYGNGPIVTFTAAGTNANTYRVQMVGGSGYTYVQRTAGSQAYTATICALLY